ncbi:hypothetical protein AC578_7034 [Pseudocercospora eumusae]|uniref:Uncharacterized protein n=1 Tax=Pseudocercospora eumusae TaxID=321146 RepID=A0A139HCK1_9PEZI|nr:hypothetical protein AC578_7034 [Pseudocercospora eumusae]
MAICSTVLDLPVCRVGCLQVFPQPVYAPTSFCKCTCFTNSTIIPLDTPSSADTSTTSKLLLLRDAWPPSLSALLPRDILSSNNTENRVHGRRCTDCTKKFCLSYNLPICKDATEEHVFTTCFQRDSVKDQAVVWIFIIATVSLLAWAGIRPYVERWREGYSPLQRGQQG